VLSVGAVIGFGIQKGGVGKTTTAGITAQLLGKAGKKVLVVDLDSQGNQTEFLTGVDDIYEFQHKTIFEAMQKQDPTAYILKNIKPNIDLLPAEDFLSFFSQWLWREYQGDRSMVLRNTLDKVKDQYDFVILDLAPNLGDVTLNAMMAMDYICIIAECSKWCYSSLSRYMEMIEESQQALKEHYDTEGCKVAGILRSIIDTRYVNDSIYFDRIGETYPDLVFKTSIQRRARIREFALTGISENTTADRAALKMYKNFTKELLTRVGK
jgi:chromosome partitioning protein